MIIAWHGIDWHRYLGEIGNLQHCAQALGGQ